MEELKYAPVPHNHQTFMQNAMQRNDFKEAYNELDAHYVLIREMISARIKAGLTQESVAEKMGTTKSAVSRLESGGKHSPSVSTLQKYAQAIGCRLEVKFVHDGFGHKK